LPPKYIVENWDEDLLSLMINKLAERKGRMPPQGKEISDAAFIKQLELDGLMKYERR